MKYVRVRISADGTEGDIHPMYGLLTRSAVVERATALQWNYTGEALGILHYVEGDVSAFEDAVQSIREIVAYDIERTSSRTCYVYVLDNTTPSLHALFSPITANGLLVIPPVTYTTDGPVVFSMFGPDRALQIAVSALSDSVSVTIESVGKLADTTAVRGARLTTRQHEIMSQAVELGYYDVPRTASQEDIAAVLDCASSTVAEHLRKAESRIVQSRFTLK